MLTRVVCRSQAYGLTETNSIAVSVSFLVSGDLIIGLMLDWIESLPAKTIPRDLPARRFISLPLCLPYSSSLSISGRASPVNEIKIMLDDTCLPPGRVGEVWLYVSFTSPDILSISDDVHPRRGPNIMKGYWQDPGRL